MSEKVEQLGGLFVQLEAWDTQGRLSISVNPVIGSLDSLPISDGGAVETPLSRTVNHYHELKTQIRELVTNEQRDEVLNCLTAYLQHPYLAVRLQAVEALGYTQSTKAIAVLVDTMHHDKDYSVKAAAAQSLGIIGNMLATPALIEVLQRDMVVPGDAKVQLGCAGALSFIADSSAIDPLILTLTRNYGAFEPFAADIREAVRDALVSIGGETVTEKLIEIWANPTLHPLEHIDESIRQEIIIAFSQIGNSKALDFLLTLAHHSNDSVREAVMTSLSYTHDGRVIDVLTNALTDSDSYVRAAAEFSLRRLGKYPP